jgi:hypothetical protein
VFLRRVGRLEAQFPCDIRAGGGIAGIIDMLAYDIQDLLLSLGKFFHHGHPMGIYTGAVIIYSIGEGDQAGICGPPFK